MNDVEGHYRITWHINGRGVYLGESCQYIFLPTSPCIDRLLAGLISRRKFANLGLKGSVIDGLLAGLKSLRKFANIGLQG